MRPLRQSASATASSLLPWSYLLLIFCFIQELIFLGTCFSNTVINHNLIALIHSEKLFLQEGNTFQVNIDLNYLFDHFAYANSFWSIYLVHHCWYMLLQFTLVIKSHYNFTLLGKLQHNLCRLANFLRYRNESTLSPSSNHVETV